MAHLIDKDALVAEIKTRRDSFYSLSESCEKGTPAKAGFYAQAQTIEGILSFLNTLEVKEVNLEKIKRDWRNKGYIEGRKQAIIPARKLGLPKSLNIIDMEEVKAAAKAWSEDYENTRGCDYIGVTVAERAFVACAEWLINKAQKGE